MLKTVKDESPMNEVHESRFSRTIQIYSSKDSPLSQFAALQIKSMIQRTRTANSGHDLRIQEITMDQQPELFEKMRIIALPTTIIGNKSIVGIPDESILHRLLQEELTEPNA